MIARGQPAATQARSSATLHTTRPPSRMGAGTRPAAWSRRQWAREISWSRPAPRSSTASGSATSTSSRAPRGSRSGGVLPTLPVSPLSVRPSAPGPHPAAGGAAYRGPSRGPRLAHLLRPRTLTWGGCRERALPRGRVGERARAGGSQPRRRRGLRLAPRARGGGEAADGCSASRCCGARKTAYAPGARGRPRDARSRAGGCRPAPLRSRQRDPSRVSTHQGIRSRSLTRRPSRSRRSPALCAADPLASPRSSSA